MNVCMHTSELNIKIFESSQEYYMLILNFIFIWLYLWYGQLSNPNSNNSKH